MGNLNTGLFPEPVVTYYADCGMMYIQSGRPFGEGEDIAKDVVLFYDQESAREVVGVCFLGGAEVILKPLVDVALAENGLGPIEAPTWKGTLPMHPNMAPVPSVSYEPEEGYIQVDCGRPLGKQAKVAEGVTVFFDREAPAEGAGLRIGPDAKKILRPLLDAVLEEYGGKKTKGAA